jgi:PAS domain S-box-containing protein
VTESTICKIKAPQGIHLSMSNIALILKISVVVAVVEAAIMLAFSIVPASVQLSLDQYSWFIIVLDTIVLTLVCSPIIYLWVIRPFILARSKAESMLSLKDSEQNHRFIFEDLPQGLFLQDYSAVKKIVDQLLSEGIEDLKIYLSNHPELLRELVSKIRTVEANQALLELYGCSSLQKLADDEADVSSWWNDDWVEFYASEITNFTRQNKIYNTEITDTQIDGSEFVTRITCTVVKGDENTWKRVLNIHEDITVQHQREEMLLDNQNLLEGLVKERTSKLEDALSTIKQSEVFLSQCTGIASVGYAIWDNDLDRDTTVSKELAIIHGLTIDEYLNTVTSTKEYLEFVVPDDREKYMNYENTISPKYGDELESIEYRITREDGEIRYLHQRSQPIHVTSGQQHQDIVVIQDITEQIAVRLEQERVANDLTRLIDTANAPIFGIDAQGKVNEWNQQAEKITGFKKGEVMGRDLVADFITDDYKVSVGEVLAKALNGNETANFEFPLFSESGDRVDVLLNSTTRRDASGKAIGVVGVGQDITDRNKSQRALAESEGRFLAMTKASPFSICIKDLDGRFLFANAIYSEWYGITGNIVGKTVFDIFPNKCAEICHEHDQLAIMKKKVIEAEVEMPVSDGQFMTVHTVKFPIFGHKGELTGMGGISIDISERKKAAAQIIQSSKLATLGEMATSVAHELNQPLNVIRMAAGNGRRKISNGTADLEYLNDKLERIEEQTARAAAIIDHMRMFGREANEHPEPIDPRNVVTKALDLMGEQLRLAGIKIVTELAEDCPSILGHAIQLEQVILNLLTNARDAIAESDGETKITLRVFEDDKGIHITTEDTGGGIPDDVLPRIFEPFYTTKEMGRGTGLGLSVSYGIVRDMNGTIVAENIGDGARFTITLPSVSR